MQISGTGITPFDFQVLPGFKPVYKPALEWTQLASGNWRAVDRGASGDVYEAECVLYGRESVINGFISEITANRAAGINEIDIDFDASQVAGEKIFGCDVDYSSTVSATVLSIADRAQSNWKGYSVNIRLRALSPSFTGSPSLPTLKYLDVGADADSSYTIGKADTYSGVMAYTDESSDIGKFTGVFTLSDADMVKLRRKVASTRGGNWVLASIAGVSYPFGARSTGSYPYTCKLIGFEDLGMFGLKWWRSKLTFAEEI